MLRRKFDYLYPNQCAKVSVRPDGTDAEWQYVGQWYTAGSNTCVYSYPRSGGELGKTEHTVITSNRRWREEEFLIPRRLTQGVKRLEIRIEHVPDTRELFPGQPYPAATCLLHRRWHGGPAESAWSESRYWAYCYKMPEVKLATKSQRH
jgi:hypothetical protein